MNIFLAIIIMLLLFIVLSYGADLVIFNLREIGNKLGLKVFFLGMILGMITSLPELSVGVNSVIRGIPAISVGNLLGGIIVLLGLVLGSSLLLHREVQTDGEIKSFLPISLMLLLPIFLSFDGVIGGPDGFIMIAAYLLLIWSIYRRNRSLELPSVEIISRKVIVKEIFFIIFGIILIIVSSGLIVKLVDYLLQIFTVSPLVIGLLLFALGTNLPEITVAFKAWRKKSSELSVSNLLGSTVANVFVLGVVSSMIKIEIELNKEFYLVAITFFLLTALFGIFYRTGKKMTAVEGACLLAVYFIFIFLQYFFLF